MQLHKQMYQQKNILDKFLIAFITYNTIYNAYANYSLSKDKTEK